MESISIKEARRLALARAGLLKPSWTEMPSKANGRTAAKRAALAIARRFGYLQLDTVSIAGARSHVLVLLSRVTGFDPALGEQLLGDKSPLFEYWGHEASWIPLELYPTFAFRRRAFREHPWWGDVINENKKVASRLLRRIRSEGALRSVDMEGGGSSGWWDFKVAKRVATALWSRGDLAIAERKNFIRSFDLAERVVPAALCRKRVSTGEALRTLLLRALSGHGWATKGTLASTWRLRNMQREIVRALGELEDCGEIIPCNLRLDAGKSKSGWIRPADRQLASRLQRVRPPESVGVLLSPFDPVLWDRARTLQLFGFEQLLEIFKPAAKRRFGYFCMPVLAGDKLIGRVDLKADRKAGQLAVLSRQFESGRPQSSERAAVESALARYADAVRLTIRS